MFTIVKYPPVSDHRRSVGEPRPEIISHRDGEQETKKWSEKMRKEETTYKHLRQHRDELLESEILYKKKIKELEKEKAELFNIYEPTYQENKVLKSVLEHGPDAVKMKKLQKARKELQEDVEKLKKENKVLTNQMNEIVQKHATARDYVLEKNWQEVLASSKKNKDKGEMKITQGPFPAKEDTSSIKALPFSDKEDIQEQDMYDLELDSVEKEIQVILNNVKYLKKQKRNVDYAILMGKSAIVKNSPLQNAIFDKLDEDLNAFKDNLKSAKKKHDFLKEKIAERENEAKTRVKASKDTDQNQNLNDKIIDADKNKSYKTSETQTEVPAELKRAKSDISSERLKLNKKKHITPKRSLAVQTDFVIGETFSKANIERIKYLDQYEKRKLQLQDAKQTEVKKVSSKKMALEYAKKLVVRRRETSPEIDEMSGHLPQKSRKDTSQDIVPTDQSKHSIQQKRNRQSNTNYRDMFLDRSHFIPKAKNPLEINKDTSQENKGTDYLQHSVHGKRSKPVPSNYRDMLLNRSHIQQQAKNSNTKTNFGSSRIKSRSVGDLNKQLDLDYKDKIMIPGIDTMRQTKHIRESKSLNTSQRYQQKSKSIDVIDEKKQTKVKSKKHKVTTSRSTKENHIDSPFIEESRVWKSESDLQAFIENEINENKPVKEFKCWVPRKDAYVHFRGEIQKEDKEKRDVSAYDEVLFDLKKQYKLQGDGVYQEFQETVQNLKHVKDSVRENRKARKNIESDHFPSIVPHAPVRFSTDARHVTEKEIRQLMKKNGMNLS